MLNSEKRETRSSYDAESFRAKKNVAKVFFVAQVEPVKRKQEAFSLKLRNKCSNLMASTSIDCFHLISEANVTEKEPFSAQLDLKAFLVESTFPEKDTFARQEKSEKRATTRRVARWFVFKPKNPNLGKFWRILHWKMLVYFMDTWSILRSFVICILYTFGKVSGNSVYFSRFGILYPEKSGNPGNEDPFNENDASAF
jgi:hypothetical protein